MPKSIALLAALLCFAMPALAKTPAHKPALEIANVFAATDPAAPEALDRLRLSDSDITLYRKIFAAQRRGDRDTIASLQKRLDDTSLVDWARMKRGTAAALWLPASIGGTPRIYHSPLPRTEKQGEAADNLALSVSLLLKTDDIDEAQAMVQRAATTGVIDRIENAQLLAQIAAARLYAGDTARAQSLAHLALQIGGIVTPEAAWTAGLASWVLEDYTRATQYFAWPVKSPYAGPWLRSASAYWTARALTRTGNYKDVSAWLSEAARHKRSFYGLIATRALGAKFDFNWNVPPLSQRHHTVLAQNPGAVRALKLAQLGQMDMARLELALLEDSGEEDWREALAALAVAALKPDATIQIAELLQKPSGGAVDTVLYPLAPWQPKDGYRLDPALINAFIRQESRFKPAAQNKASGATGLLQLMPRTARAVDRSTPRDALTNPETSMMLGQKYLEELLDRTDGNLFEAAIAYNAGPGKLAAWKDRLAKIDDSLLFIELIPYGETRAYVERVMANYWIYSLRMGAGVASLDAVAAGRTALYAHPANRGSTQIVLGASR